MQFIRIMCRFTNLALLLTLGILTLIGVYGLIWTLNGWVFEESSVWQVGRCFRAEAHR